MLPCGLRFEHAMLSPIRQFCLLTGESSAIPVELASRSFQKVVFVLMTGLRANQKLSSISELPTIRHQSHFLRRRYA